jgi:hypothetical protein
MNKFKSNPIFLFLTLITLGTIFDGAKSFAFPDLIRHGYFSCASCHVSPSGGGLLSSYGKSLSSELLSTWGGKAKGDDSAAESPEAEGDWWLVGGDLRSVQIYSEDSLQKTAKYIPMQADIEAAVVDVGNFSVVGSVGLERKKASDDSLNKFFSRRHYVLWRNDQGYTLRGGRFYHAFGLGMPDHIIATRQAVENDFSDETYNIEGGLYGETFGGLITLITPSQLEYSHQTESGVSAKIEYTPIDRSKVGMSLYNGKRDDKEQTKFGVHGVAGFSENFYALAELNTMTSTLAGIDTKTLGGFTRLAYEFHKGIVPYLQIETLSSSSSLAGSSDFYTRSFGLGAQWFPIRMLELNSYLSTLSKKISGGSAEDQTSNSTFAWLMIHFYY